MRDVEGFTQRSEMIWYKTTLTTIREASLGAWRTFRQLSLQVRPEVMKVWTRIEAVETEGRGQSHDISFWDGVVGICWFTRCTQWQGSVNQGTTPSSLVRITDRMAMTFAEMRRLRRACFRGESWCWTCGPTSQAFLRVTSGLSLCSYWLEGWGLTGNHCAS